MERCGTATGSAKVPRLRRCSTSSSSRAALARRPAVDSSNTTDLEHRGHQKAWASHVWVRHAPQNGNCPRSPMAEAAGLNPVQRGFDPRRGYSDRAAYNLTTMDTRFEEDPDEDPTEPSQPA